MAAKYETELLKFLLKFDGEPEPSDIWQAAIKLAEEKFTCAQQPQPAMCLGCEYWRMPSGGHCMRGEGVEFCFKVGTHAGVR